MIAVLFFLASWINIYFKWILLSSLFQEATMNKANYNWFSSTLGTSKNLTLLHYKASSNKWHIKHVYRYLCPNLDTSHKATGQSIHLDVLKYISKYHCHQQSLIFHQNQPFLLWPALRCYSQNEQEMAAENHATSLPFFFFFNSEHVVLWSEFQKYISLDWNYIKYVSCSHCS